MSERNSYAITTAEVSIDGGIKVVANVDSIEAVEQFIKDLQAAGLHSTTPLPRKSELPSINKDAGLEDPANLIETQAGLESGQLLRAKILAIKDGAPQILRSTIFDKVTDAVLVLMLALEVGLRRNPVNYEDFSALFESHNLKSGSPLSMLVTNLRNGGYLDNRIYSDGRKLRLTAKGQAKAIEVLKRLAG